ncbi:hypothetical protein [Chitinophaga sp. MM2321]|uniref:hypothetical protein n=1 Tax=Chitinophaga sp. MM2321 TaxID=3137178 RepID=UPI0032D59332
MKKLIFLMSAALLLSAHTLFAKPYETAVNNKIQHTFSESFSGAKEVKWYTDDNITFTAKFTMVNTRVTAFFNDDGTLLATSRYLQADQLPLNVISRLNKKFPATSIYCVVEYAAGENALYYITLEGKDTWTIVRADRFGSLKVQNHLKKA